jgi:RNA polymerase sigma factor (sigma-70 family)
MPWSKDPIGAAVSGNTMQHARELSPSLIERALARDPVAIRQLVDELSPVIQARVARILVSQRPRARGRDVHQDVEDLVQQVFVALFANDGRVLRQWDPNRGFGLLGYVGRVAECDVLSILRSRRQCPWTEEPTPEEALERDGAPSMNPENDFARREILSAVVQRLREHLSERGFALFQLLVVEERPIENVCAAMDMSPDAVYAWRSRLARFLRSFAAELA